MVALLAGSWLGHAQSPVLVVAEDTGVAENGTNAVFHFRLLSSNAQPVTITYSTGDYTAIEGEDYWPTNGTLVFPPGVLEQTVHVGIIDDVVWEGPNNPQFFFMLITSASNAVVFGNGRGYIDDNESPPQISILDAAPVIEGDTGTTNAFFEVRIVPASDWDTKVDFASAEYGYGQSWSDIYPTVGALTIPARSTNGWITVQVLGDTIPEATKIFYVNISNPWPFVTAANVIRSRGTGTMLDDDSDPGKIRYFQLTHIPSPQIEDRPFPLTITAMDAFGNPVTNYQEIVEVTAYAKRNFSSTIIHTTSISNFVNGVWSGYYSIPSPATNVNLVAWDPLPGRVGSSSNFDVRGTPNLFLGAISNAVEGDGVLEGAGVVSIARADSIDLVVDLSVSDPLEIAVPDSVTIPAGQTSAVFNITILDDPRLDGSQLVSVTAASTAYFSGSASFTVHDNESTALHVSLPNTLIEGVHYIPDQAYVWIDSPVAADVVVQLVSSDTSELGLFPTSVTIPSGESAAFFAIYVQDDNLVDGAQPVSVTASVSNWVSGSGSTEVRDNESTNLIVLFSVENNPPIEGQSWGTSLQGGSIQVRLSGLATSNIWVSLVSSDTTELVLPPALLILAGRQSGVTNIVLPDDTEFDGSQTVTATASAPGFIEGTRDITVRDNDIHHFVFNPIANQTRDVPFEITLTPLDVNNVIIQTFGQTFELIAQGPQGLVPITPTNTANFVRGTGTVTLWALGTNIFLTAVATNGSSSQSNPFNVAPRALGGDVPSLRIKKDGDDAHLTFKSLLGRTYSLDFASNLPPSWVSIFGPTNGTGGNVTLVHPNAMLQGQGFYRLRILE
jgi:hypothetical protein